MLCVIGATWQTIMDLLAIVPDEALTNPRCVSEISFVPPCGQVAFS